MLCPSLCPWSARASCQILVTAPHHGHTVAVPAPVLPQLGVERKRTTPTQKHPNPPLIPTVGAGWGSTHTSALQGHWCRPHPFPLDTKFTSPKKIMLAMGDCRSGETGGIGNHHGAEKSSLTWETIVGMGKTHWRQELSRMGNR